MERHNRCDASPKVVIASPPEWGPVGYDEVEYYYLPDIQVYYDIRLSQYIYFGNGKWIRSRYLPSHCRNYDLYHGYKVVLTDYHGHSPYNHYNTHKVKYYKGYKGKPQKSRGEYKVHYEDHVTMTMVIITMTMIITIIMEEKEIMETERRKH